MLWIQRDRSFVLVPLMLLLVAGVAAAEPSQHPGGFCGEPLRLERKKFDRHSTDINNRWLPLIPGRQLVYEGFITPIGGVPQPVDHQVIFTVTDLTKEVGGVRSRVMYDVDVDAGVVAERELAFFAQDEDGNVWNMGEYPEEYENGEFLGAENTWIHGLDGAFAGIHMFAVPQVGTSSYLQGLAPDIDFLDCGRVTAKTQDGFNSILEITEWSPLEPDSGFQVKYYEAGVGNIQIAAVDDPEGETLVLTEARELNQEQMNEVRAAALELDARAYQIIKKYRRTSKAKVRDLD